MSFSSRSLRTALTLALLCALVILVPESSFSQSKARVADRSEGPGS